MRAFRPILLASLGVLATGCGDLTVPASRGDRPEAALSPRFTSTDTTPDPLDPLDPEPSPRPSPADTTTWRGDLCTLEGEEAKDPQYCPAPPDTTTSGTR